MEIESDDEFPDIIAGGFDRAREDLRPGYMSERTKNRLRWWIESCQDISCIGFVGGLEGVERSNKVD